FAGVTAWRENQYWRKVRAKRFADQTRPEVSCLDELRFGQHPQIYFHERHGPLVVRDEDRVATDALKPPDDILRIFDAAAQEQEWPFRRRQRQRALVRHAPNRIGD